MSTHYIGRAEAIRVDTDEGQFCLILTTDSGLTYSVNVHGVSAQLLASVELEIGAYWKEGLDAYESAVTEPYARHDAEQADAYDLRNPKHPTYHDRMSALADDR